jgi:hypothetical protein
MRLIAKSAAWIVVAGHCIRGREARGSYFGHHYLKVYGVVIGVGGFLGMGQHDIKVEMSKLKFVDEPVRTPSSSTSPGGTTGSATAPANRPAATTASSPTKNKWYPDHAVLSGATKDSLKGMPEFKYD